ncbi:MAG: hypothetical protein ACR2JY_15455, partial [Chloroflexota bacterium]
PSLKMEVSPTVDVTKLQTFGQNARVAMFAAHWGLTTDLAVSAPSLQFSGGVVPHPPGGQNGAWQGGSPVPGRSAASIRR